MYNKDNIVTTQTNKMQAINSAENVFNIQEKLQVEGEWTNHDFVAEQVSWIAFTLDMLLTLCQNNLKLKYICNYTKHRTKHWECLG